MITGSFIIHVIKYCSTSKIFWDFYVSPGVSNYTNSNRFSFCAISDGFCDNFANLTELVWFWPNRTFLSTFSMVSLWTYPPPLSPTLVYRVPVRVSHVAIGESSKELSKPSLWILAILAKSINIYFSSKIAEIRKCFKIIASERY